MDQQRIDAKKSFKKLSFWKKVEHIWFYYKRLFIVSVLVLLLIGYSVYEVMSKPKYDFETTFYSEVFISDEQVMKLEEFLTQFVEDRNGDGRKNIKIHSASVAMLNNEVEGSMVVNTKFSTEMAAGAYPFVLVDSTFYEILKQDAYSMAIEKPQELTAIPDFQKSLNLPEDVKVYWVTRSLYNEEKDDAEAIQMHDATVKLESNIFGSNKK